MTDKVNDYTGSPWSVGGVEKLRQLWKDGVRVELISQTLGRPEAEVRAKAAEYELTGRLTYRLTDARGKTLLRPQTLNSSRIYTLDEKRVTGKAEEERLLRREIHLDMVNQLVRQLQRVELDRLQGEQSRELTPPDGS